jgi:predicted short-subunit dehydrogenase-like oxidoreductase (DUF2520 family)
VERVNLIGAGKVGQTLARLIAASTGYQLGNVYSRSVSSAEEAVKAAGQGTAKSALTDMAPADLWLICVPDDQITATAQALSQAQVPPSVALHCSGFLDASALVPLTELGWQTASCHPVLSFADPAIAAGQIAGTYCAVEGSAAHCATALITALHGHPFPVNAAQKALYHAAAVFSNNFTTVLQAIAQEAWAAADVPPDVAKALGQKLLDGTAASVARLGPSAALTGPAARGDDAVLTRQGAAVGDWHPEAGSLYQTFSTLARRLKDTGSTLP